MYGRNSNCLWDFNNKYIKAFNIVNWAHFLKNLINLINLWFVRWWAANVCHVRSITNLNDFLFANSKLGKPSNSICYCLHQAALHKRYSALEINLLGTVMKSFNKSVFFNNKALLHNDVNRSQNNEITIKEALKQISQVFGFLLTDIRDWIHSFILFNYLILFARI